MNRPLKNSADGRVALPYSSEGEWILHNYAQLWEKFSQEEPQVSPQRSPPSTQLPVIPEGHLLAVTTLGEQADPSQSPEAPSTAISLPRKRVRLFSWESASESSASESALPETILPQPISDPGMTSSPRPRRKRKKGSSGPASLSPPDPARLPEPAALSAGMSEPAAVTLDPEPATKRTVSKSAVVRAEERAAADSATEAFLQSFKSLPVLSCPQTLSPEILSQLQLAQFLTQFPSPLMLPLVRLMLLSVQLLSPHVL
ncbi:lysine-rich arabinogalactan protein 19-like [Carassius auratus]|uniref:Lysine-rich arabinogalactan protein 19-like n=1 Tax=Carassius auratus TaxID=7957 RepID=A0A6P6LHI3_CARAU|nr:lysine-rich arabinogalactan protein 19-like [Carassius auratus]